MIKKTAKVTRVTVTVDGVQIPVDVSVTYAIPTSIENSLLLMGFSVRDLSNILEQELLVRSEQGWQ